MNIKVVGWLLGRVLFVIGIFLLIPLLISLFTADGIWYSFLIPSVILLAGGGAAFFVKPKNRTVNIAAGFVTVALSWILISFFGALPFAFSGGLTNFADALFESASGFTTTGATVLKDIEILPKSLLFWRALTHWIGGLGVLLFVLAILPRSESGALHIFKAETTGPTSGKLVSKLKGTARILYLIHVVLTLSLFIALTVCDMEFFDAVTTSLSVAGTGGFSVKNASIAAYGSPPIEIVVLIFMFVFSVNYNLYFLIIIGKAKRILKSEELKTYLIILLAAILFIALNILSLYNGFLEALRYSAFHVLSVSSTTGFTTADFGVWPAFSQVILMILMFLGSMAGSTGGGIKISRFLILIKSFFRDINKTLRPRSVKCIKLDGELMEQSVVDSVQSFYTAYLVMLIIGLILISLNGFDFATNITAVITCLSNTGPGLSKVSPAFNFSPFSSFSKLLMCVLMLLGRLEIFPILFLFYPGTWRHSIVKLDSGEVLRLKSLFKHEKDPNKKKISLKPIVFRKKTDSDTALKNAGALNQPKKKRAPKTGAHKKKQPPV